MWITGTIGKYEYHAKVYDTGSRFGINGGRVSKLEVRNTKTGREVINYQRGWDLKPWWSKKLVNRILAEVTAA